MNNKKFREIELSSILYEPTNNSINSINNKDNNLANPLINNSKKNSDFIINDNDNDNDNDNNNSNIDNNEYDDLLKVKILPKFTFMHFFCNNLYFDKCRKFKSQETLHICNAILLKYMSIESILYNQMNIFLF